MYDKLKIVFYTDAFLPARDGLVVSVLGMRRELERRGHEVYVFASGNESTKRMVKGDDRVFITSGMQFKKYPQYSLALMPLGTAQKIKEINPDIIHAHTPFMMGTSALAIAKLYKIPIVSTFHTLFTDKIAIQEYTSKAAAKVIAKYSWSYARFFYNKCDGVMAPSQTIKKLLEKKGINVCAVVHGGINPKRFNMQVNGGGVRRKLQRRKNDRIVLYVGRMSREKRIETILKAAKLVKDEGIRFIFVGAGPALDHYKKMSERMKLGDAVHFTGFVEDDMLPKYYAASDLFCIASTFETQGLVIAEAMACGKPVVGADSLAISEIIKNGRNGEKFRPNDAKDCARKIKKVINNIGSYKEMTATASEYALEKTTDALQEVYNKILKDVAL